MLKALTRLHEPAPSAGNTRLWRPGRSDKAAEPKLIWRRPRAFCAEAPELFSGKPSNLFAARQGMRFTAQQRNFVAAVNLVAQEPERLSACFVTKQYSASALYKVRFFVSGRWQIVEVDDWVLCDGETGMPALSRSFADNEIWMYLLEKAYATLCGSYQQLWRQSLHEILRRSHVHF